jgi:hypothetical protein
MKKRFARLRQCRDCGCLYKTYMKRSQYCLECVKEHVKNLSNSIRKANINRIESQMIEVIVWEEEDVEEEELENIKNG